MNSNESEVAIYERIIKIITNQTKANPKEVSYDSHIDDLSQDSLELFALVSAFEKEFGLQANYQELIEIRTIGDIVKYLQSKTA